VRAPVTRLGRRFFARDALDVAPDLINKVLVVGASSGRIVEVEAYRSDDPASHTFRGMTSRNATMFGPAGHLYVYFTYGMHHCANISTGATGDGQGVLLRAIVALTGLDALRARRPGRPDRQLADGPGKLCQAFGLDRRHDGLDVTTDPVVRVVDDGAVPASRVTTRIGIRLGTDRPWRWLAEPTA